MNHELSMRCNCDVARSSTCHCAKYNLQLALCRFCSYQNTESPPTGQAATDVVNHSSMRAFSTDWNINVITHIDSRSIGVVRYTICLFVGSITQKRMIPKCSNFGIGNYLGIYHRNNMVLEFQGHYDSLISTKVTRDYWNPTKRNNNAETIKSF